MVVVEKMEKMSLGYQQERGRDEKEVKMRVGRVPELGERGGEDWCIFKVGSRFFFLHSVAGWVVPHAQPNEAGPTLRF
jgi:hypothetical protein